MLPSRLSRFLAAAILVLAMPTVAIAQGGGARYHKKIDRVLQDALGKGGHSQRVIIRTKPGSRAAIQEALEVHGDVVNAEHPEIDALSAEVHGEDIEALAASDRIESISVDAVVSAHGTGNKASNKSVTDDVGHLRATLGLDEDSPTGEGVVVAVVDSGIAPLVDFRGRIAKFVDCTLAVCTSAFPTDSYGHGTHVAGLIAGSRTGVAPRARLVVLRVLDENGQGFTSDVIKALEWIRQFKDALNIQAVNLSLGHPIFEKAASDPLVISVENLVRQHLKVAVAAGNYGINPETGQPGYAGITSPANAPSAIAVGALDSFHTVSRHDDRVAPYSSRGPTWYDGFVKPDLVAPSDSLTSTLAPNSKFLRDFQSHGGSPGTHYISLSGTSMGTAVTSGVIALMLQANREAQQPNANVRLSSNTVKAILQYTAIPVLDDAGQPYNALTQGAGGANAGGAITVAAGIDATKLTPAGQFWLTGTLSSDFGQTVIGGQPYAWASNIIWGDNIVWGSGLVTHSQSAWDDNIVWGSGENDNIVWGSGDDNIVWGSSEGDNIVWGSSDDDNIVWGSAAEWADNIVWGSHLIGMTLGDDNIVWGSLDADNIVWGSDDNIVWGSLDADNVVWGSLADDNVVWGSDLDNVVWGSGLDDNIVWGSRAPTDGVSADSGKGKKAR